jgi:predicted O-methyltransferase YrrM
MKRKRWDVIIDLLKNKPHANGAEIGVWKGQFTLKLLENLPDIKQYYCVDSWAHYDDFLKILKPTGEMATCNFDDIFIKYKKYVKKFEHKIINLRMTSVEASKKVSDNSLDFVFIDANHAYEYIKEDILAWMPKVKKGGLISGHDYSIDNEIHDGYGVVTAVNELLKSKFNLKEDKVWYLFK